MLTICISSSHSFLPSFLYPAPSFQHFPTLPNTKLLSLKMFISTPFVALAAIASVASAASLPITVRGYQGSGAGLEDYNTCM
jgi:hypothetical protein